MENMLFQTPISELMPAYNECKKKQPAPLSQKFANRISKRDAVEQYKERQSKSQSALWPSSEYKIKILC